VKPRLTLRPSRARRSRTWLGIVALVGAALGSWLVQPAAAAGTTVSSRVLLRHGASASFPGSPWAIGYTLSQEPASGDMVELDVYSGGTWSVWSDGINAHRSGVFDEDWRMSGDYTWRVGFQHNMDKTFSRPVTVHVVPARTSTYIRPSTKILNCTSSRRSDGGLNVTVRWTVSGGRGYTPPGTFQRSGVVYTDTTGENVLVFYTVIRYAAGAVTKTDVIHNVAVRSSSQHTCASNTIHYT
jgi:hypothetical protein